MQRAFLLVLFLSLLPFSSSNEQYEALGRIVTEWHLNQSDWKNDETCMFRNNGMKENDDFWIKCICVPINSTSNCSITELKVYGRNVKANIHEALFNLTDLTHLNLSHNLLNGSIPSNISRLTKLEQLDLRVNNLSGSISPLSNLRNLTYLGLSANMLSGDLSQLENLISLEYLYIDSNKFSGSLGLQNLNKLMTIWAFDNKFTGDCAASTGNHKNLTDLRIYGTSLQCDPLRNLSSLHKLVTLMLGDLGGNVRDLSFLNKATNLSFLSLRNSNVTGNWTNYLDTLKKLANLTYLDLSFNKLTGSITLPDGFNSLRHLILGNNNLSGEYPIHPNLTTLDVSFNDIKGTFSSSNNLSINYLGTSITSNNLNTRDKGLLSCPNMSSCTKNNFIFLNSSFAVNCGGEEVSNSGIIFRNDTDPLGAANFSIDPLNQWVVSNVGYSGSPSNSPSGIVSTNKNVSVDEAESSLMSLYQTARVSTSSLRYYLGSLENGNYSIHLHFAEIVISDNESSWECLGRRVFDIYIQNELRQQDFNIIDEAQGSFKALNKSFTAEVTNYVLEIHLFWAGKGTFGIPHDYTYGPLLSAISISRADQGNVQPASNSTKRKTKRAGIVTGIAAICVAAVLILLSIGYLWWKRINLGHIRLTDSAMKG